MATKSANKQQQKNPKKNKSDSKQTHSEEQQDIDEILRSSDSNQSSNFPRSRLQGIPSGLLLGLTGLFISLSVGLFFKRNSTGLSIPLLFLLIVIGLSLAAISFSFYILTWIYKHKTGNHKMNEVASTILEGSEGFFKQQYGTIFKLSYGFCILISILYGIRTNPLNIKPDSGLDPNAVGGFSFAILVGLTFMFGAACSAFSGYAGMEVSVRTNIRVSSAARSSYNTALRLAFAGGYFGAIINVALAILGVSTLFVIFYFYLSYTGIDPVKNLELIPMLLIGFGFGASFVAMFAQLGGGIYTKAADVGADLVGKLEKDLPEDDERNPAVIADLVGDNVGDCAGQAADLFESISAEIISAMILGATLSQQAGFDLATKTSFMFFPLALHCLDMISSTIGSFFVKTKDSADEKQLEDALDVMKRGYVVAMLVGTAGFVFICYKFLNPAKFPKAWIAFSACGGVGVLISYLFMEVTQYYTDYKYAPVQRIVKSCDTGHATNIIAGLSVGMESTGLPILIISVGVLTAYHLGRYSGIVDHAGIPIGGLFGTAVATMGMFCTGVYILSMSGFGPIADNAGGIVEMSGLPQSVRNITDRLDAVGNVTKANAKGYSVGSASMACFLLFSAFLDEINFLSPVKLLSVDITIPEVFVGGLLGSTVCFVFAAWAIAAVGNAAQDVIVEVRRQMTPDVISRKVRPDYNTCVAIVTKAGQRQMVKPGLLSVLSPIAVGVIFKGIGVWTQQPLLCPQVICAFLMFSTATGILLALFLNNAGGAWDNTKKFIESQGMKKTEKHSAAVSGDTVGDPCKDTAGPSLHILIKLVSTITLVMAPFLV